MVLKRNYSVCFILFFVHLKETRQRVLQNKFLSGGIILYSFTCSFLASSK